MQDGLTRSRSLQVLSSSSSIRLSLTTGLRRLEQFAVGPMLALHCVLPDSDASKTFTRLLSTCLGFIVDNVCLHSALPSLCFWRSLSRRQPTAASPTLRSSTALDLSESARPSAGPLTRALADLALSLDVRLATSSPTSRELGQLPTHPHLLLPSSPSEWVEQAARRQIHLMREHENGKAHLPLPIFRRNF